MLLTSSHDWRRRRRGVAAANPQGGCRRPHKIHRAGLGWWEMMRRRAAAVTRSRAYGRKTLAGWAIQQGSGAATKGPVPAGWRFACHRLPCQTCKFHGSIMGWLKDVATSGDNGEGLICGFDWPHPGVSDALPATGRDRRRISIRRRSGAFACRGKNEADDDASCTRKARVLVDVDKRAQDSLPRYLGT